MTAEKWWVVIVVLGIATFGIKAAGPFLMGERDIPSRLRPAVLLLPTALMTALVTVAMLRPTPSGSLRVDAAQCVGLATAALALLLRLPLIFVLAAAVSATVTFRLIT